MSKSYLINIVKELLLIFFLSSFMAVIMIISYGGGWNHIWSRLVITYAIWLAMWFGNGFVAHQLDNVYSWLENPGKRLFLGFLGAALYSALAMFALEWVIRIGFNIDISGGSNINIISAVVISVLVIMVLLLKEFLLSWRALALQEEKIKNEVLTSNFEMLKSQVNPHFMFNSLNTLTSLIYQNQDLAAKYVGQLSHVYRSVLTTNKSEVITIAEELKTLDSYIFLQSIRFEGRFNVEVALSDEVKQKSIPPMVLQMLIENCIKHNEITEEKPLKIKVYQEGEMVCVQNTKAPKQVLPGDKSSIGLQNIKARYKMLSDIPVQILDKGNEFIVKLPLLTVL
jgi:histidine kinase